MIHVDMSFQKATIYYDYDFKDPQNPHDPQ